MASLITKANGVGSVKILAEAGIEQIPSAYIKDKDELLQIGHSHFSKEIPVISLIKLHGKDRERVLEDIRLACEEWGIFQIVDHGVTEEIQKKMMELVHGFFMLPLDEKLEYAMPADDFCGYANGSFLKDNPGLDWRELYVARCRPLTRRDVNKWPARPTGFRETFARYSDEMLSLANLIISAISDSLGLPSNAILEVCGETEQKVLLNYYPTCPQAEQTLGLKRHTDPGTITILLQDNVSGLQATKDGQNWVTVEPTPGAFVVNLGDHFHVLTNGRLKNADHRATVNASKTRTTVAAFWNPAADSKVCPLPALVDEDHPPLFEAETFSEFYNRKMRMAAAKTGTKA
nr:flavone synthase I [Psilotum nudum]